MSNCRFCSAPLRRTFADLGVSPLSNSFIKPERLGAMEPFFPLHAYVCERCFLVQLEEYESPQNIFNDYVYFASFSTSWLEHCAKYAQKMVDLLGLTEQSSVVEIASNDGYLLQYFKEKGIPVLGVEPADNVATVARQKGIPTETDFFNDPKAQEMRSRGIGADLIVANNVLAHVPDIKGFVKGFATLLNPNGVATFEFPHLLRLIEDVQFDTMYHEHFSYLSLYSTKQILESQGLRVYNVEELPTHGGSLRVYAQGSAGQFSVKPSVEVLLKKEKEVGILKLKTYDEFGTRAKKVKRELLSLLIKLKEEGKTVVAYGAAAKGNTLLNYCGIRTDFIDYVVDKNPHKQNLYLPGSHIPVYAVEKIYETKPDYVLILPWNLRQEISAQMQDIKAWGGRFIVPIPEPCLWG